MEQQNNTAGQTTINVQVPSASNIASRRPVIPVSFALAIICFFFTFCDINCGGQKMGSLTGINLVTGTQMETPTMFGQKTKGQEVPASIWAIFAFGAAIIGLGAYLIKEKREALIGTGAGLVGAGSLIILQFGVKSAIEKESKGQVHADFQLAYWGALLALGVAGGISYLRMQQTHQIALNFSSAPSGDNPNAQLSSSSTTSPSVHTTTLGTESGFDAGVWLKENMKLVIGISSLVLCLGLLYYFLLRHDPESDAKKAASAYCDCQKKHDEELVKTNEEFAKSFDPSKYKSRQEARTKLLELQNEVNTAYTECNNKAEQNFNELRNRYLAKDEQLQLFDKVNKGQSETCTPSDGSKLTVSYVQVEEKINLIKDPEPDMEKIKNDLIGKTIPGWSFDYLSEFKTFSINLVVPGENRLEYQIHMNLKGQASGDEHDCDALVTYIQDASGWRFSNISLKYITYTNEIPADNWVRITPLQNCSFNVSDDQKLSWKTSEWGNEFFTGPDYPGVSIPYSQYYVLKSREGYPVKALFTYKPRN